MNRIIVPFKPWLPLRPLLAAGDKQTTQPEAVQSDVAYPDLTVEGIKEPVRESEKNEREVSTSKLKGSTVQLAFSNRLSAVSKAPHPNSPPPDTLVFIDYPNSARFAEYVGLATPFRVHSANLLKTGSRVFRELLSPTKNFRAIRRRKLVNQLPEGVKYVIDLTPPDEGDEAVRKIFPNPDDL